MCCGRQVRIAPCSRLAQEPLVLPRRTRHADASERALLRLQNPDRQWNRDSSNVSRHDRYSLPISNINFWRLQNVSVLYCNGGIFVAGYDDNGGYATGCTVYG